MGDSPCAGGGHRPRTQAGQVLQLRQVHQPGAGSMQVCVFIRQSTANQLTDERRQCQRVKQGPCSYWSWLIRRHECATRGRFFV